MSDLISREAAIDALLNASYELLDYGYIDHYVIDVTDAEKTIRMLPSAESDVKTGKWIKQRFGIFDWDFQCGQCGKYLNLMGLYGKRSLNYCPNCGAKMEMPEDD